MSFTTTLILLTLIFFALSKVNLATNPLLRVPLCFRVGGQLYQEDAIPGAWASYFEDLYTPISTYFDPCHKAFIDNEISSIAISPANSEACVVITAEDVNAVVLPLPRRKASGPDQVSVEHLINAPACFCTSGSSFPF